MLPRRARFVHFVALTVLGLGLALPALWLDRHRGIMGNLNAARLNQIGQMVRHYNQDFGGAFPESLSGGLRAEGFDPSLVRCPESSVWATDADSTYVYVGRGLTTTTADGNTVVAYAPLASAGGSGSAVLFADGHTDWVAASQLPRAITIGRPPIAPSSRPTTAGILRP